MGACLSKKKGSSLNAVSTAPVSQLKNSGNGVTVTLSKPTNPELNLKKTIHDQVGAKEGQNQVKKEIFIIKHRKSHDESREKSPKIQPCNAQQNKSPHSDDGLPSKIAPSTPNIGVVGVRTSSCTKEEVDAILIQCGRLSRSSSGRAASSSAGGGRKYSGSKRSFDFDHCDNDANFSADDDQRRANAVSATDNSDLCEDYDGVGGEKRRHQHRERRRQSPRPSPSRRRTPSRERDQQNQRSSSRERRVSRSPGRPSSETNSSANGANAANSGNNGSNNNAGSRPGKMVSVPATVSSLVMDKSNNGGGESGIKRITVKRNVGECAVVGSRGSASPRSQSPARGNGNAGNAKLVSDNHHHHHQQQQQQQPSLSRNNSARKAEHSPYRRNPLSEIDPNSLACPQPNTNNCSSMVQNRPKKEIEVEANQKPYALEKDPIVNCKTKELIEEEIWVMASMNDNHNVVVKTMVPSGVENLKPQNLSRSRSSRRSRDLDLNPEYESLLNNPTQSYTSLLLEDIQNFHQKNTQQPSISLPACLSKACSILEAVADLNSTTSSNFSGPPSYRNELNNASSFGANNHHYGKNKVTENNTKDPFVESEVHVFDDVMEPSLHKYVTVKRGGSVCGLVDNNNMEDQESSGSNSFFTQHHFGISSNTWEANSADSTDSWTSRLMEGSDAVAEARKALSCKKRECDDHQHSSGIGRGRLNGSSSSNNKCSSINTGL